MESGDPMDGTDIDLGLNDRDDLPCPRCGVEMKKVFITQRDILVAVDHCIECEGYWFDSEELNSVVEDKEKLIATVDRAINEWRERGEPKRNPFMGNLNRHVTVTAPDQKFVM